MDQTESKQRKLRDPRHQNMNLYRNICKEDYSLPASELGVQGGNWGPGVTE